MYVYTCLGFIVLLPVLFFIKEIYRPLNTREQGLRFVQGERWPLTQQSNQMLVFYYLIEVTGLPMGPMRTAEYTAKKQS